MLGHCIEYEKRQSSGVQIAFSPAMTPYKICVIVFDLLNPADQNTLLQIVQIQMRRLLSFYSSQRMTKPTK